ncbi:MAG TPA: NAD(P)/FAD-dependent oxidoreductase [Candidatus Acidoferrales bacterium]|nr:NAD(P)/FAD-dependent oxidoreductase [Candidatus Acidoferrales bacterium]
MVDVLISGGGIAGSALAILLGRGGLSVELFEREIFPREKPCGEGLMPAGVAVLERLGLTRVAGGAPFQGVRYRLNGRCVEAPFPRVNGRSLDGRGVRRKHLDHLLFQTAAETSGVRAYAGACVERPIRENGCVAGVIVNGEPRRAKLVVAADGVHSRIRRDLALNVSPSRKRMGIRVHYRLACGREQGCWVDVALRRGCELYVTPLADAEILIAALTNVHGCGEPIYKTFRRWILVEPFLAQLLEGAEQISEPACASWPVSSGRFKSIPGVALLGDAAGSIDPISGGGMTHALLTAELLATHIQNGIESGEEWMSNFERERRRLLAGFRRLTQVLLWLAVYPGAASQILTAAGKFPSVMSYFAGVAGGVSRLSGTRKARKSLHFDAEGLQQLRSLSRREMRS